MDGNKCCAPHMVQTTMSLACIDGNFCDNCLTSNDEWNDGCSKHMEELFAKQHDCCVLLMRTQSNKYLIGRIADHLTPDSRYQQVLMFGDQEMGYRGWVMCGNRRIGIVPFHEKNFITTSNSEG